ncbi:MULTISPECIES: SDR family oxidoreductase [unclassified Wenzhouxiangella]|uniref:SDR family oxidoreductase n=1 Tax=unclassified Wenzhouxiangella TaxID=2613841 RepID=UPI000E32816D|nr:MULTISPECIES: SDR family oxidoreductase [unclassified Wenzhouxiangella]RFF27486.1 SDR family oxidoreductase [Wenzhouxiangella sp. 15181]RFP69652.1 SDR family oxidoreductase [Wenzhouxiangella sp. 15190]
MKVVLITGAAAGLGRALAKRYFDAGHRLVLADLDEQKLKDLERELDAPERVLSRSMDVTDADAIAELVDATRDAFGQLDILINNAGITHRSPAHRTDPAVFKKVMAVDWQAPIEFTLACLDMLRESRGQIVNIGSMAGWMPLPGRAAYGAAKSALTQFFEVLRMELKDDGVDVLMVYPSFLKTDIEANALGHDGQPAGHAQSRVGKQRDADWMAQRIVRAAEKRKRWLFPDRLSSIGSLLWRISPSLYLKLIRRKFEGDLR